MNVLFDCGLVPLNGGLFISRGVGRHPDRVVESYEIIFVVKGVLGIYEDARRFQISPGECLLLEPGKRHGGTVDYPSDLSFYWIHFKVNPENSNMEYGVEIPKNVVFTKNHTVVELFRRFLDNQEAPNGGDPILSKLALLAIFRTMELSGIAIESPRQRALVERVELYLDVNFLSETTTSKVAKALSVNPDYMGRVFKSATGRSLTHALHERRIGKAKMLLLENLLNISEIAYKCGYKDLPHFRRMFKRHAGVTPSMYRNLNLRLHVNSE
jgi:AraC-like DNA-binding protein